MSLVSQSIPGLHGGVSQQSAAIRHTTQCELMENALATIVRGLSKRPPSQHVMQATATAVDSSTMVHFINRSATEQYAVFFMPNGVIKVFDLLNKVEKTVYNNAASYLPASPSGIRAITVADYTFVVNTSKVVTAGGTAAGSLGVAYTSLHELNDPTNGIDPPSGYHEITGDGNTNLDSFYVLGDGQVWREVAKPGVQVSLTASTMPHALVRRSDGHFEFGPLTWDERGCGDDFTNPMPSFVGRTISDVFFHRNRLGFIAGENIVFSEAGEFFNFFRTTVMDLLDSDPIDTAVSHNRSSLLKHAVPFSKSLYLFSAQAQFVLSADNILTPRTAGADQTTEYEVAPDVRPVGSGSSLFFVTPGGAFSHLYEYYVDVNSSSNMAANITAHVPQYLPSGIKEVVSSVNYDMAFCLSGEEPNALYVYKHYWQGTEKVQSAWGRWSFGPDAEVLGMECIGSFLYLVINRAAGTYIEKIDLEVFATTDALGFLIHLDRLATVTKVYDPVNEWTTFGLPYDVDPSITPRFVLGAGFTGQLGRLLPTGSYTRVNNYTFRVPGDYTAGDVYVGEPYTMTYRFSPQFVQGKDGKILKGDLRIRTMTVYYDDSAYFVTKVHPYGRSPQEQVVIPALLEEWNQYGFTGKTVGAASLVIGQPSFQSGSFRFPVLSNAKTVIIELTNDSHLACHFTKAEWEGNFVLRSRRL